MFAKVQLEKNHKNPASVLLRIPMKTAFAASHMYQVRLNRIK